MNVTSTAMYGDSQPDMARTPAYYERHDSNDFPQSHNNHSYRVTLDPPRHIEPRPALQTSLSDATGLHRRQQSMQDSGTTQPAYGSSRQNLPALRDIFTPGPQSSERQSFNPAWSGHTYSLSNEERNNHARFHPPMVLHPPTDLHQRRQDSKSYAHDVPILDTNPVSRFPAPSLPISPYSGAHANYSEPSREPLDHHRDRPYLPTAVPYANAMPNSYVSMAPGPHVNHVEQSPHSCSMDETHTQTRASNSDRETSVSNVQHGTDQHGNYLGVEDMQGKGRFHVYEDGYRIPTQVDGEHVNPAWGLTKANKPRKRLALACLDCREKKIKCEPGKVRCLQCEKAMRSCRRAPEKGLMLDPLTANMWPGADPSPGRKHASSSDPTPPSGRDIEPDPLNKRRTREDPSPPNLPNKKHRSASPPGVDSNPISREGPYMAVVMTPNTAAMESPMYTRKGSMTWEDDPYAVDTEMTLHLLDLYFSHVNNATLCMFPRSHFLGFVKTYAHKCQNERMVLYAMLAAASVFAEEECKMFGKQCALVAADAVNTQLGRFNIAVAQSKMLLGLYHFSKGSMGLSWDYSGSAVRTVTYLSLNTEEGCRDDGPSRSQSRFEFGFSKEQLAECKRRTFWSAFFQDRYCGASNCIIKPDDIFVRLPCTDEMYEESKPSDAPHFSNSIIDPTDAILTPSSPIAPIGWQAIVAAVWGDVSDFAFRASYRASTGYQDAYESFYSSTWNRLQGWQSRLPDYLRYSEANLDRSIQQGYASTFVSMHALYHLSLIKMNRYYRHGLIPGSVGRNIRAANNHGHKILQLMSALNMARREISAPAPGQPPEFSFSTQFPGYAALAAIDVVGAGGLDSQLKTTLDEINGTLGVFRELSKYWSTAKEQMRSCEKRFYQIKNVVSNPQYARSGCWLGRYWGMLMPMEEEFSRENDCIYGLAEDKEAIKDGPMQRYFDAFKGGEGDLVGVTGGLRIA